MNRIIILDAQVEPVWPHTFLGTLTSNFRYVLKYRFINKSVVCCPRPVIFMATRKLRTSNQPRLGGGGGTVLTISPLDFVNFAQTGGSGHFAIP